MDYKTEIKKALSEKRIVIGSREVIKKLKMDKPKFVVIASNCPESIKNDIEHYAKLAEVEVKVFDGTAKQLGIFCGKPFSIAALAITSDAK
jgi:large subunit ribosomal protein L30e